jgi:hypothetical protein
MFRKIISKKPIVNSTKRSNERSEITPKGLNMKRSNERSEIIATGATCGKGKGHTPTPKGLNVKKFSLWKNRGLFTFKIIKK